MVRTYHNYPVASPPSQHVGEWPFMLPRTASTVTKMPNNKILPKQETDLRVSDQHTVFADETVTLKDQIKELERKLQEKDSLLNSAQQQLSDAKVQVGLLLQEVLAENRKLYNEVQDLKVAVTSNRPRTVRQGTDKRVSNQYILFDDETVTLKDQIKELERKLQEKDDLVKELQRKLQDLLDELKRRLLNSA